MQRARTALLLMNCVAIVGYAAFPLMPPRLVPDCDTQFGGCDADYSFVDTMDTLGGIWSWRGSALAGVSRRSSVYPFTWHLPIICAAQVIAGDALVMQRAMVRESLH